MNSVQLSNHIAVYKALSSYSQYISYDRVFNAFGFLSFQMRANVTMEELDMDTRSTPIRNLNHFLPRLGSSVPRSNPLSHIMES